MSATITAPLRVLTALVVGFCLCLGGLAAPAAAVGLGTMTGQVSDAAHEPLPGAGVSLFEWVDHGGGAASFDYVGTKVTGSDGAYSWSGLAAGDYYARVSRDGYATAYSDGATTDPLTATQAGVFHLAADASRSEDFTLTALHSELGTLSGTVIDEDGAPVDALQVEAFPVGQTTSVNLTYTVGGSFTFHLPAGDYSLRFHDVANRYPDDELPGPLAVSVGETTTAPPFTLASPQAVTASGTVTDAGGTALQGADVTLWRVLGSGPRAGLAYIGSSVTDASGAYELTGLGEGLQYTVEASKDGYRARFLGDVAEGSAALTITAAETNVLDTIHLPVANQVAGRVTGAGGAGPLADVKVSLLRWTPGSSGASFLKTSDYDVTGPDGTFSIAGVAPGSYTLSFEPPDDGVFDIGYLNGRSLPPGPPPSAGTFTVATEASDVTGLDVALSRRLHGTGQVRAADGPLAGATVEAYRWDEVAGAWDLYDQTTTDATGDYHLRLPHNATVTLSAAKNRFARQFLGGASSLSAAPSAGDHVDTLGSDVTLEAFTLARRSTSLGSKAGQDLPFCYAHDLQLWSDSSSGAVPLPATFPVRFFGTAYDELYVNDNGNITFGGDNTTFTPEDLTTTDLPVIAPFWADMDGRGNDVAASYGFSPDGTRFCAVWTDMGYYDRHADRLNTVQLLLTSAEGDVDRSPGDFDITFDYDQVAWDAGDFDGGQGGLAAPTGRSAAAGFSAGTGAPSTSFQLDGSLVPGSLVDGGSNALVEGSAASTTPGRYVFQVRNDGSQATAGSVSGEVTDQFGAPVDGATATLLRSDTRGGTYTPAAGSPPVTTDASGRFSWDVPPGWYQVEGSTPGCDAGSTAPVRVPVDRRDLVAAMACAEAEAPAATTPPSVTGTARVGETLTAVGATWPTPLERRGLQWLRNGAEIPGANGTTYEPTPADLGAAVSLRETGGRAPAGPQGATVEFDTVDAVSSGVTVTSGAAPTATTAPGLTGTARVGQTLAATPGTWSRSGLAFGYTWLRNGSPVPGADAPTYTLTSADAGTSVSVRVTARQDGYDAGSATSASTVVATGSAAATTSVPRVSGRPAAGQRLVADPGTWAGSGWTFHYQWLRNGSPVTGASGSTYVPPAGDIGALLSVRVTATQPGYDAGTATSAAVTVSRFVSSTSVKLAKATVSTAKRVKVRVIVAAPGASAPTGKVRVVQRGHVVRTVSLVAGDAGSATTRLPRLDPGRYRIRADYAGSRTVAPSRSSTAVLKVR